MRLFGGGESRGSGTKAVPRIPRVSSGWAQLSKTLREQDGLRVLDVGVTSSTNINFLTNLGHSVYMANVVEDAADSRWKADGEGEGYRTADFVTAQLDFGGRLFDVILFWDTADYLPGPMRDAVVNRLSEVMVPGGLLLAFFHIKPENGLQRYHLREDGQVDAQFAGEGDVATTLSNRQIEQMFHEFASYRFFLAKDNLREVLVTR